MNKHITVLMAACILAGCSSGNSDDPVEELDPQQQDYSVTPMPVLEQAELDHLAPPSENFDLLTWKLNLPIDIDGDGRSDDILEPELSSGYDDELYFYTAADGGMVFHCPIRGTTTSSNTSYVRVELREMLRRGDTSIDTRGVNANNWVFSSAPESDQQVAAGVDGKLRATLAINHVTTTGAEVQQGRVIIGQVHAENDEPIRLYYRKRPQDQLGVIYFAHELFGGQDIYYDMIGDRSSLIEPDDGIALNEVFSYEIDVTGNILSVSILREGLPTVTTEVDMTESGYDRGGDFMYFKAGIYNLNNTGEADDYSQATFYALEAKHF